MLLASQRRPSPTVRPTPTFPRVFPIRPDISIFIRFAAKEQAFDVVLIDTAGRMQDNSPLMKSLSKLVSTNNPDKIVFVGEALVGNEAVDQLTKFDRSLREGTRETSGGRGGKGGERGIEGIVLTKFDTIVRVF